MMIKDIFPSLKHSAIHKPLIKERGCHDAQNERQQKSFQN